MHSISEVWTRLFAAIELLASDAGSPRDRLGHSIVQEIAKLDTEDFPEEIRDDFETIQSRLANIPSLSTKQVIVTCRLIVSLLEAYAKLEVLNITG